MIDAFSQTDWRRFVTFARTRHRKAFISSFLQSEGSFDFVCRGTIEGTPCPNNAVANDILELQYLELDHCIDLLHICNVWKDCLRIGLPVRWNVICHLIFGVTDFMIDGIPAPANLVLRCRIKDKGVCSCHSGSKHIHSNQKLTMQGLKVNAYSIVSVIGREHF